MFTSETFPQILVGLAAPDDAAIYRLDDERAIISTTDFFPPVVDDAYAFGAIAAANALSDVYAVGGRPLMAINLAAYPDGLDMNILTDILRGGADKVREAGAVITGGHTVADKEPKYGLAVTGEVHPDHILRKGGAQPGDVLVLTKALGTGVITTALKAGVAEPDHIEAVIAGMLRLNRAAAERAQEMNAAARLSSLAPPVRAATDITGYGLIGHSHELAHLSSVDLHIDFSALRWYPGTEQYARADRFPGGQGRNLDYFGPWVVWDAQLDDWQQDLLFDPQTSGGLLLALADPAAADDLIAALPDDEAAIIGTASAGDGHLHIHA